MYDDKLDELVVDIRFYNAYNYSVRALINDPRFSTDGLSHKEIEEALSVACDYAEAFEQFSDAFYY